jgi:DNA-binding response OmpR family regulator
MRVLVLDDHQPFRDDVVAMLARNNHEGVGVGSAEAAIPMARKGDFDFILVDYSMPEHDGIWFLKHAGIPRQTRALLVTAHTNVRLISEAIKLGAVGYLIKPFDESDLLRHLEFHARRADGTAGAGA